MKITVEYVIYMNSYKRGEGGEESKFYTFSSGREQLMGKVTWSKIGDNEGGPGRRGGAQMMWRTFFFKIFAQVLM